MLGVASTNGVFKHLAALERKGAIELIPGSARGIRVRGERGLPLVGRVAAGSPILAIENMLGRYPVDPALFTPRADYLLQVSGLSMRDDGILDGDLIAVHRTPEARSGQTVVARVDGEITVKRLEYSLAGDRVRLLPRNPEHAPIEVDPTTDDFAIEGLYVGVLRGA